MHVNKDVLPVTQTLQLFQDQNEQYTNSGVSHIRNHFIRSWDTQFLKKQRIKQQAKSKKAVCNMRDSAVITLWENVEINEYTTYHTIKCIKLWFIIQSWTKPIELKAHFHEEECKEDKLSNI